MKIFTVDFQPEWPVPCGLIIAASTIDEARSVASEIIEHTNIFSVTEVNISKEIPTVIFYESGNY